MFLDPRVKQSLPKDDGREGESVSHEERISVLKAE
jgi:hypothetical protein